MIFKITEAVFMLNFMAGQDQIFQKTEAFSKYSTLESNSAINFPPLKIFNTLSELIKGAVAPLIQ